MRVWTRRGVFLGATAGAAMAATGAVAQMSREQRIHEDWAYLSKYREENASLAAAHAPVDIVFMGDSITEFWRNVDPAFFTPGRVCRGISGQTTPQMLVRFRQDVIDLRPRTVHIMAGTNDVAGNTGPMTPEMTQGNLRSMAELARAHQIHVVFGAIPPASRFFWAPSVAPAAPIMAINTWLRAYAQSIHAGYADYHSAMRDAEGGMRPDLADDGVHPNARGYAIMDRIAEQALAR
ncbi:MAG TPA: GDSL-type esterase/lipase family protein [Caulobacterales bacterium]|nr:GDSL-type esterase/lipase family protein [Caulobacterales bacterium]